MVWESEYMRHKRQMGVLYLVFLFCLFGYCYCYCESMLWIVEHCFYQTNLLEYLLCISTKSWILCDEAHIYQHTNACQNTQPIEKTNISEKRYCRFDYISSMLEQSIIMSTLGHWNHRNAQNRVSFPYFRSYCSVDLMVSAKIISVDLQVK